MEIIDSHSHLFLEEFKDDFDQVIGRARMSGLSRIINVGLNLKSSLKAIKQAESAPGLHPTVGWHPHEAKNLTDSDLPLLVDLAKKPEVVAFGEIGLDFFHNHSTPEIQIKAFGELLSAATEVGKPVIIHCRDAFDAFFDIIAPLRGKLPGVLLHCFSGTQEIAKKSLDLDFHLSFSGSLTYPKLSELRQIAKTVPRDRILIETDAPFLAPGPHRGHRNEPAMMVYHILPILAESLQISLWEAAETTAQNTTRFFSLTGKTLQSQP
jgi:TatD DNase family protein